MCVGVLKRSEAFSRSVYVACCVSDSSLTVSPQIRTSAFSTYQYAYTNNKQETNKQANLHACLFRLNLHMHISVYAHVHRCICIYIYMHARTPRNRPFNVEPLEAVLLLTLHAGLEALGGEWEGPAEVDSQRLALELLG